MRVLINRLAAAGRKTGIGHYTDQLVAALRRQAGDAEIDVFPGRRLWPAANAFAHALPLLRILSSRSRRLRRTWYYAALLGVPHLAFRTLYQGTQAVFRRHARAVFADERFDLYHEPNFIPFPSSLRTVVTLHDLSVVLYPHWHPAERVERHEAGFHEGLKRCEHVVTDSDCVRREAIRYLHLPPERVTRVYPGVGAQFGPLPVAEVAAMLGQLGLRPGYLLYLGTIEPRKNVLMLLRAYCALPEALRERSPLLLVGQWGWRTAETAEFYRAEGRPRGVKHLGYVADRFLPALYNGARALVYPSLYEGFGLPPVEMMACGGAVLASTADTLVETVGRQAHLIDGGDEDGWRRALVQVIEDEDWLRLLRQGATRTAAAFSWERCAADTLRVYRRLTGAGAVRQAA